ncbi:DUF4376 domain-containing protein [Actinobacillus minor]|uniref:DUF4376 domain-containing protein n=1 Tax=Actinobacillus minor TaxID=51047 RepID=UPI0023F17451|nr:DUF4376 domain-containing protein [Actinobacillus minor]MDD6911617.1 DUF4376 domain-containing protein [Actinobacillus minor]MDY4712231.1 DUF4376 domain-containing protein [Actinobacillus minor]
MYLLHIIDDSGHFELIDSDFINLYNFDHSKLVELTDEQYQQFSNITSTDVAFKNGEFIAKPEQPSLAHKWDGETWVLDKVKQAALKAQQQEQIRQAINAKRDQVDASGVFVAQIGKWVDSDDKAYQNILGVKASLDLLGDMEIEWTWADNTSSTINRQTLAVIVGALLQAKQANHANAIKHKEAVMLVDNPLEYDYSTGWTKTYADYVAEASNE